MHSFVVWIDGDVGYISNTVFDGSYGIQCDQSSNFHQNYWWLRSPFTGNTNHAWQVDPSGYVIYGHYGIVANSYGSPDISFIFGKGFARVVSKSGSIGIGDFVDAGANAENITLSYGKL